MPRKPSFCSFASFLIDLLTPFNNKPDFSRDLKIFSLYHLFLHYFFINGVIPDPRIVLYILAFASDAAAVNPSGIKTLQLMV